MTKKESLDFLQSCIDKIDRATEEEVKKLRDAYFIHCEKPLENSEFEFIPPVEEDIVFKSGNFFYGIKNDSNEEYDSIERLLFYRDKLCNMMKVKQFETESFELFNSKKNDIVTVAA